MKMVFNLVSEMILHQVVASSFSIDVGEPPSCKGMIRTSWIRWRWTLRMVQSNWSPWSCTKLHQSLITHSRLCLNVLFFLKDGDWGPVFLWEVHKASSLMSVVIAPQTMGL